MHLILLARQQLKSSSYLLEHTADSMDEKAGRKLTKKGAKSKFDETSSKPSKATLLKQIRLKIRACLGHLPEYLDDMITSRPKWNSMSAMFST